VNSPAERLTSLLLERFAGRTDAYLLEAHPARTVYEPLTPELVSDHLAGRKRIGIFPNGRTSYLGFDLDGKNLPGGADEAYQQAQKIGAVLDADLGLPPMTLELTRSGKGYRGLVFFDHDDAPSVAEAKDLGLAVLRAAGLPDDEDEDHGHPGIYPHTPGPKGIGKTAFMPLGGIFNGGVSRFLDAVTREPLDRQETPLEDAQLVTREAVLKATKELVDAERERHVTASRAADDLAPIGAKQSASPTITRPADDVARHDVLRSYTMRWANAGLGEIEVRTFASKLADDWGMLPERGNEVENLVIGAMLKARPQPDEAAELPYPSDLYGKLFAPKRPDFDVKGFVRRAGITLIWAAPGGLKTHTTMVLVHEMLCDTGTGRLFKHPGLWINRRWKRVLWIATEECGDELRYQAEEVLKGLGRERIDGELHYVFASAAGNRLSLDDLPALIERDGPWDAIVLDSLTGLRPKMVNGVSVKWDIDNDAANEMCLKLRGLSARHQVCFLIVHHSGRDTTRYRGATDWWASADSMIGLTPDGGRVKLEVEKVRGGKKPAPFTLEPEWGADGSFSLTYAGSAAPAKLSDSGRAMLVYLKVKGTASQTEMIKAAGCARSTGQKSMKALIDAGYAVDTGELRDKSPVYRYRDPAENEVPDSTTGHLEGKDEPDNAPF
jgi:hypothetical protein